MNQYYNHPVSLQAGSNMCVCGEPVNSEVHVPDPALVIRDRDQWNEHLANEVSLLILAVPIFLRGPFLRRVAKMRRQSTGVQL